MAASEKKSRGQSPSRSAKRECCGIPPPNGGHHAWCMRPFARARPTKGMTLLDVAKSLAPPVTTEVRSALPAVEFHPLARVTRIDHSALEDRLEQANALALEAWLRGGRTL